MIVFVFLAAQGHKIGGRRDNEYTAVAVGLSILAGGHAGGWISGGCFNPAVALGLDITNALNSHAVTKVFGYSCLYIIPELFGAAAAAWLSKLLFPCRNYPLSETVSSLGLRCTSEALGAFYLVLTVCLNVF